MLQFLGDRLGTQRGRLGCVGVTSVAAFGNTVHVAGPDAGALDAALAPFRGRADLRIAPADASLEDVFIALLGRAQDNFADGAGRETRA